MRSDHFTLSFIRAARLMALVVMVVALAVLVGWALDLDPLKRVLPGLVSMNPVTAVCFLMGGVALWLLASYPAGGRVGHVIQIAAVLILLTASLRLSAYVLRWEVPVDQLLFAHKLGVGEPIPNRMAPNTAMTFLLIGLALFMVDYRTRNGSWPAEVLALVAGFFSVFALTGYAYGAASLYGIATYIPMALHTAICFILLSMGMLFARPQHGLMAIVLSETVGGFLARRLLPAVVLVPVMLGWLRIFGQRQGWYSTELGAALHVVVNVVLFVTLVWWIAAILDRLDRRRMGVEAQIRQAKQAADAANRAKTDFLANMSHEIRTPMTAIIGYTDLMLDPEQSPSERLNCVNTVRRNGDHLLTIINDILDISKIEAGELAVERISCSPCQLIGEVASLMRVRATEKQLEFQVHIAGPIPKLIRSDSTRLRQILINLVGNAVKFTDAGWVRLGVNLSDSAESANPHITFEVSDSGIGMTPQQMKRIFQPFAQADASTTRRFGGTGLGLTISKRLAQMLGGDIEVKSVPGQGSTFSLRVETGPLADVPLITRCTESILLPTRGERGPEQRLTGRILLAEDGVDNQRLLAFYLRKAGAEVIIAENGRIACEQVRAAMATPDAPQFDLVFMDMQMPELDGYGATALLRSKGFDKPIVALTAHALNEDRAKCINCGCSDYLSKPVNRTKLVEMAAKYIPRCEGAPQKAIESELTDESVQPFLLTYIQSLPKEVDQLHRLLEQQNVDDLKAVLHRLKGSGGLYGFMPITERAAQAERTIVDSNALDQIAAEVKDLIEVIRRVQGYDLANERRLIGETVGAANTGQAH